MQKKTMKLKGMHEDWREVGQRGEVREEEEGERDRETERKGKG